ncbi:hypothetical protein AMST5_01396 [freshwater sediment metagenome]|uniref:GlcNAc-PI de-N-acetylase n=1 Tax=freshwater sediment metagenome TaxID=556182 RepID=A0AA48M1H1_9ZZZZ
MGLKYTVFAGAVAISLAAGALSAQAAVSATAQDPLAALKAAHAGPPANLPAAASPAKASTPSRPIVWPGASSTAAAKTSAAPTTPTFSIESLSPVPGHGEAAVFLSAHPDDFLLFNNPSQDAAANARMIYIFVTAGDAGLGAGPPNAPYYLAREAAAIKSIRFMADAARPWQETATPTNVTVNGHSIFKYSYRSSVAYFLRLPDGNGAGEGFAGTGNVSIVKLYNGSLNALSSVENSTSYNGWPDLVSTVSAIVKSEISGQAGVWINANDTDESKNPGDHYDHYVTGALAAAVQKALPCMNVAYHVGYALAGATNLSRDSAVDKSGAFAAYVSGLNENNYFGAWDKTHKAWLNGLSVRLASGFSQCSY